jgi:hypothetical protein
MKLLASHSKPRASCPPAEQYLADISKNLLLVEARIVSNIKDMLYQLLDFLATCRRFLLPVFPSEGSAGEEGSGSGAGGRLRSGSGRCEGPLRRKEEIFQCKKAPNRSSLQMEQRGQRSPEKKVKRSCRRHKFDQKLAHQWKHELAFTVSSIE